jgi:tetratricopeptide (TPR) repeat protein
MADLTLNQGRGIEPGAAPISGDPAIAEQTLRSVIEMLEVIDGSDRELVTALIEQGRLAQQQGHDEDAEEHFRKALAVGERGLGPDDPGLLPALTKLAAARMLRGIPEEAEPLLARALTISEAHLGGDHPDLVILLNDFTRLCLKQSAYALAEPLLLRLLAIKRNKGEDHPEFATVLASLAVVRQGLGRHESAEELWRRVLDIRERTLAPNHFALATALEHLADACAARGKLGEALQLLQRAQAVRELTLGTDHSSVRVLRERIADLQLQASEDSLDHRSGETVDLALDGYPLLAAEVASSAVITPSLPGGARGQSVVLHKVQAEPAPDSDRSMRRQTVEELPPPLPLGAAVTDAAEREAAALAYRNLLLSTRQELDEAPQRETLLARAEAIFEPAVALLRRQYREVASVAGVLILLVVVITTSSPARSEIDQSTVELPLRESHPVAASVSEVSSRPSAATGRPSAATRRPPAVASNRPEVSGGDAAAPASEIATLRARALEQLSPRTNVSRRNPSTANISVPTVPLAVLSRFDSLAQRVTVPVISNEPSPNRSEFGATNTPRSSSDNIGPVRLVERARLISAMPVPRYPQWLSIAGEVRVRFNVDTTGRPVMATFFVVNSPEGLFTDAVRSVIPGMRFFPARMTAPPYQAVVETVEMRFRFTPRK